ncbi:MAG TPA: DNA repair protein RecO [Xanthomonadaceae bacterium]|nr:DNA repair protein RecO [Xanthomonadaceae bacterium]
MPLQPAYVLIARPYRETSLLVEALCEREGRVGLVARGVRSRRGQPTRALLQPLQPLLLAWRGRGDLPTLSQVEAAGPAHAVAAGDLLSAFYLNELVLRLLQRHDPHPGLFQRYRRALDELVLGSQVAWTLRRFERDLLTECGYALQVDHDVDGAAIVAGGHYRYDPERGPWPCQPCAESFAGEVLIALRGDVQPAAEVERGCRQLLRGLLERHASGSIRSLRLGRPPRRVHSEVAVPPGGRP